MAKNKQAETNIKEKCNKCGSLQFAIDKRTNFRHCSGKDCGNVWNQKSVDALLLQQAKDVIKELEEENDKLLKEVTELRAKVDEITGFSSDDSPLPSQTEKSFAETDFAK